MSSPDSDHSVWPFPTSVATGNELPPLGHSCIAAETTQHLALVNIAIGTNYTQIKKEKNKTTRVYRCLNHKRPTGYNSDDDDDDEPMYCNGLVRLTKKIPAEKKSDTERYLFEVAISRPCSKCHAPDAITRVIQGLPDTVHGLSHETAFRSSGSSRVQQDNDFAHIEAIIIKALKFEWSIDIVEYRHSDLIDRKTVATAKNSLAKESRDTLRHRLFKLASGNWFGLYIMRDHKHPIDHMNFRVWGLPDPALYYDEGNNINNMREVLELMSTGDNTTPYRYPDVASFPQKLKKAFKNIDPNLLQLPMNELLPLKVNDGNNNNNDNRAADEGQQDEDEQDDVGGDVGGTFAQQRQEEDEEEREARSSSTSEEEFDDLDSTIGDKNSNNNGGGIHKVSTLRKRILSSSSSSDDEDSNYDDSNVGKGIGDNNDGDDDEYNASQDGSNDEDGDDGGVGWQDDDDEEDDKDRQIRQLETKNSVLEEKLENLQEKYNSVCRENKDLKKRLGLSHKQAHTNAPSNNSNGMDTLACAKDGTDTYSNDKDGTTSSNDDDDNEADASDAANNLPEKEFKMVLVNDSLDDGKKFVECVTKIDNDSTTFSGLGAIEQAELTSGDEDENEESSCTDSSRARDARVVETDSNRTQEESGNDNMDGADNTDPPSTGGRGGVGTDGTHVREAKGNDNTGNGSDSGTLVETVTSDEDEDMNPKEDNGHGEGVLMVEVSTDTPSSCDNVSASRIPTRGVQRRNSAPLKESPRKILKKSKSFTTGRRRRKSITLNLQEDVCYFDKVEPADNCNFLIRNDTNATNDLPEKVLKLILVTGTHLTFDDKTKLTECVAKISHPHIAPDLKVTPLRITTRSHQIVLNIHDWRKEILRTYDYDGTECAIIMLDAADSSSYKYLHFLFNDITKSDNCGNIPIGVVVINSDSNDEAIEKVKNLSKRVSILRRKKKDGDIKLFELPSEYEYDDAIGPFNWLVEQLSSDWLLEESSLPPLPIMQELTPHRPAPPPPLSIPGWMYKASRTTTTTTTTRLDNLQPTKKRYNVFLFGGTDDTRKTFVQRLTSKSTYPDSIPEHGVTTEYECFDIWDCPKFFEWPIPFERDDIDCAIVIRTRPPDIASFDMVVRNLITSYKNLPIYLVWIDLPKSNMDYYLNWYREKHENISINGRHFPLKFDFGDTYKPFIHFKQVLQIPARSEEEQQQQQPSEKQVLQRYKVNQEKNIAVRYKVLLTCRPSDTMTKKKFIQCLLQSDSKYPDTIPDKGITTSIAVRVRVVGNLTYCYDIWDCPNFKSLYEKNDDSTTALVDYAITVYDTSNRNDDEDLKLKDIHTDIIKADNNITINVFTIGGEVSSDVKNLLNDTFNFYSLSKEYNYEDACKLLVEMDDI